MMLVHELDPCPAHTILEWFLIGGDVCHKTGQEGCEMLLCVQDDLVVGLEVIVHEVNQGLGILDPFICLGKQQGDLWLIVVIQWCELAPILGLILGRHSEGQSVGTIGLEIAEYACQYPHQVCRHKFDLEVLGNRSLVIHVIGDDRILIILLCVYDHLFQWQARRANDEWLEARHIIAMGVVIIFDFDEDVITCHNGHGLNFLVKSKFLKEIHFLLSDRVGWFK